MAACASMPKRIQLITVSSTAEIIVGPPGEPVTKLSLPSRSRIVGVIELNGLCPGAMALASDCISPKSAFGTRGGVVWQPTPQQMARGGRRGVGDNPPSLCIKKKPGGGGGHESHSYR